MKSMGDVDTLTGKNDFDRVQTGSNGFKKWGEGLHGDLISSIVYTVHKRIAKIMNTVHINT
jgi:hypothetical protein